VRRNPYRQVSILPGVRRRRHSPVPAGQSVKPVRGSHHLGALVLVAVSGTASARRPRPCRAEPPEPDCSPTIGRP
jgi:hypothetical protein